MGAECRLLAYLRVHATPPPGAWDREAHRDQLVAGQRSVVAVDDTAGPELEGAQPERKAHAAIVVTRDRMRLVRDRVDGECLNVGHSRDPVGPP